MRLLYISHRGDISLTEDLDTPLPEYAILSHTWGDDSDEVKYQDILDGTAKSKAGYAKLEFCAERAREDKIDHFWVDTCCINKNNDPELSEAIRSMFRWYQNAAKCYVLLSDVSSSKRELSHRTGPTWEKSFRTSRWFKRGWTLQELLAPTIVEFYSRERVLLGTKDVLAQQIHGVTGIPTTALCSNSIMDFSVEERFTWAEDRQTKKTEDKAYCLFGLFDVHLPVLYGEGEDKALRRLRKEIGGKSGHCRKIGLPMLSYNIYPSIFLHPPLSPSLSLEVVTPTQVDQVLQNRYNDGRLNVERLSGDLLPLESCFVNLHIINYVRDSDMRTASNRPDRDPLREGLSKFSLAARLNVETPLQSHQVSLSTLFEPREQPDGKRSQPRRVLIWGRAGMGKTTLCKKIVHEVYRNGLWKDLYDRVVWLPLRRLKKIGARDTIELIQKEFPFTGLGERIPEALQKLIDDSRTLFLLDGLDEVFTLDPDSSEGDVLRDFLSRQHVIITSRPHGTRAFKYEPPDLELETVGFFPEQVEEYLQCIAMQSKMTKETVTEISTFIKSRSLVQSLARIPVQLDAICHTWDTEDFPRDHITMTSLYLTIAQSLWKDTVVRLRKKHDGELITKPNLENCPDVREFVDCEINFLQELAFRGLCKGIIEFGQREVKDVAASRTIFGDKPIHISFLRTSDSSVQDNRRTLHFIHLTFQEFFAAQYFVRHWISGLALDLDGETSHGRRLRQSRKSITPSDFMRLEKYSDRYNIFWRFVVGLLQVESDQTHLHRFFDVFEDKPRDLIGRTHQRIVMHYLSEVNSDEFGSRYQKLEDGYVQLIRYELQLRQKWTKTSLGSLVQEAECSDYALQILLECDMKKEVLQALYGRSSISAALVDEVLNILSQHHTQDVKAHAVKVVGKFCGSDQRGKFEKWWHNIGDRGLTTIEIIHAWQGTWNLQEPAAGILISLLQDPDSSVRSEAVQALGRQATTSKAVFEALVSLLQDLDSSIRSEAVRALGRQATLPNTVIEALISLLHDPVSSVQSGAAAALGRQSLSNAAVEALVSLLRAPDLSVRSGAVEALGRQANLPNAEFEALVSLLQDPNRSVRVRVVEALGSQKTRSKVAVDTLFSLLQDQDWFIRISAVKALGGQANLPNAVFEALVLLLQSPDYFIRSCTARALRRYKYLPNAAVEALVSLLQDPHPTIQAIAVKVLVRQVTLPDVVFGALVPLLQDSSRLNRVRVANALDKQMTLPKAAVEALLSLLQSPDGRVYPEAVEIVLKHEEILIHLPTLKPTALQRFVESCLLTNLMTCFCWDGYFWTQSSGVSQKILLPEDQLRSLEARWLEARNSLLQGPA